MKLKYILPALFLAFLATSCSTDNDGTQEINELEGLVQIQTLSNNTHTIELYNTSGKFLTGYNAISIRIKDKTSSKYIENASIAWNLIMEMPTMQHSCPKSAVTKASDKTTVYEGFIIYQMVNLDGSGWSLTMNYNINGIDYSITDAITVMQFENQNVTSFMGSDGSRYIMAIVEPKAPKIAINDMIVGLYKMETTMSFPAVENFTITLDPRMPGMGNHSSPNNTNLTYNVTDAMYHGDLSLTMTGYWMLNLKLLNIQNEVLKGEDVSSENTQSSLYLELEF